MRALAHISVHILHSTNRPIKFLASLSGRSFCVDIDNNALRYYFGSIFIFYYFSYFIVLFILFNFIHFTLVLVTWSLLLFVCVFQEVNFSCVRRQGQGKLVPFNLELERATNRLHKEQR